MRAPTILSICALLAGCGSADVSNQPVGSGPNQPAATSPGTRVGLKPDRLYSPTDIVPNYVIDANVGVGLYDNTYAITTNGSDWIVAWTGDAAYHEFSGTVLVGGNIFNVVSAGLNIGDYAEQTALNQVDFDGQTDGGNIQSVSFSSDTVPVRFDLYVDGIPAVYQVVYSSSTVESTTDAMPFDLTPAGTALRALSASKGGNMSAAKQAPAFSKSSTLTTASAKQLKAPAVRSNTQVDR